LMGRAVGPGRASLAGLRWLAGVGPSPFEAWGVAMGWADSTTFSHASRLTAAGLAAGCATRRGGGSLLYATRSGVEASGLYALPLVAEPAPSTWAHLEACAWTSAWLTARGRHVVGTRELLLEDAWRGELEWLERDGLRRRAHRPDLAAALTVDGRLLPIEVELASKSLTRLRAILALHAGWIAARKTAAVIYVCVPVKLADRVQREAAAFGLAADRKTLRVELLETIRAAARAARSQSAGQPTAAASEMTG
jgi:hypothetical protein